MSATCWTRRVLPEKRQVGIFLQTSFLELRCVARNKSGQVGIFDSLAPVALILVAGKSLGLNMLCLPDHEVDESGCG